MLAGSRGGTHPASVQIDSPGNKLPVIVYLETRKRVVTIMSGHEGRIYTVTTKDGRTLGQHLCEQQLQEKLPNIYYFLKTSYADDERTVVIWAGL